MSKQKARTEFYEKHFTTKMKFDSQREMDNYIEIYNDNPTLTSYFDSRTKTAYFSWDENNYTEITDKKRSTMGKIITVRELLNAWWNSVRITGGSINGELLCYKNYKGEYILDNNNHPYGKRLLDMCVKTQNQYEDDADGFPIIRCTLVLQEDELNRQEPTQLCVINACNQWHEYASFRLIGVVEEDALDSYLAEIKKKYDYSDEDMDSYIDVNHVTLNDLDI